MKMFSRRTYRALRAFLIAVTHIWHPVIRVHGKENIPEGAAVMCSNHSAFSDPIWIIVYGNLPVLPRTMAKQELLKIPVLGALLKKLGAFPVDRSGTDISAIKTAMKTIKEGNKLVIFPEGTRIRGGKKSEPHSGALLIATRTQVPIVPIFLSRKKHPFSKIDLVFGKPYHPEYSEKHPTAEELDKLSVELMDQIYKMGENL